MIFGEHCSNCGPGNILQMWHLDTSNLNRGRTKRFGNILLVLIFCSTKEEMEATEETLNIKFTQLKMTLGKTHIVIEAGKAESIKKQLSTLRSVTAEINDMRLEVAAKKIGAEEEITAIKTWSAEINAQLEKANNKVLKVLTWIEDRKKRSTSAGPGRTAKVPLNKARDGGRDPNCITTTTSYDAERHASKVTQAGCKLVVS